MSGLLNLRFVSSLDSGTGGVDTAFACFMFFGDDLCVPLIGFISDAFFGPSQRLWSKVVRLDLALLLHSSLHPLQVSCWARHREVVAVHRQFELPVHVLEVARTGQPSLEAALLQKRRVLLSPVLRGISGSVQAQVESCDLALITRVEGSSMGISM